MASRLRDRRIVVVPEALTHAPRRVPDGFSLGLAVASAAAHAGDRPAAVRAIVQTLEHELERPIVAWHVDGANGGIETVAVAGLTRRVRAELVDRCEVRSLTGSRRDLIREVERSTREALGVASVTTVDAGAVVFAVAGDLPSLQGSGALLADVLATVPVPGPAGDGFSADGAGGLGLARLTEREREVLTLLAAGLGTRDVAARLEISPMTVKTHVQNILAKLGVSSRLEAALLLVHGGDTAARN